MFLKLHWLNFSLLMTTGAGLMACAPRTDHHSAVALAASRNTVAGPIQVAGAAFLASSLSQEVGPPLDTGPRTGCDQSLFANSLGMAAEWRFGYPKTQQLSPDLVCNSIHKAFAIDISYQSSVNGKCYEADLTGTREIACYGCLPQLRATNSVKFSDLPSVYADPAFWARGHGQCIYVTGDLSGPYGFPEEIICGANHSPPPLDVGACPASGTSSGGTSSGGTSSGGTSSGGSGDGPGGHGSTSSSSSGSVSGGTSSGGFSGPPKLVGSAIDTGPRSGCDQSRFANSLGMSAEWRFGYPKTQQLSPDLVCNSINKAFAIDISYQSSVNGNCYEADLSGTYQIACVAGLPTLPVTNQVTWNDLPSAYSNPSFWAHGHGECIYVTGDLMGPYGFPEEIMCGGNHSPPPLDSGSGPAPGLCRRSSDCTGNQLCFGVTPNNPGTCQ